jgi:SAM-dependent methyltransferase
MLRPLGQRLANRLRRSWTRFHAHADAVPDVDVATLTPTTPFVFLCNVCGTRNDATLSSLDREARSCAGCGSNVRFRSVVRLVVRETLGADLVLPGLKPNKQIRGLGLSDDELYAPALARKLDYVNTYFDRKPRLDIADVEPSRYGQYDFIVSSDVFEHVVPPVSRAFENAWRMLKPGGKLIFTVPFNPDGDTVEHFPDLHDWRIDEHEGTRRLSNRRADGTISYYDRLVFHGGEGATLEMRVFSQAGLLREFERAGFSRVRIAADAYLPFGIHWPESWSVPMVAYR